MVSLSVYGCRGTLLRRVVLGGQPRHCHRTHVMSSNKRNIDPSEVSNPSPGPIRPSGTANHRRENELAEEDRQRRDADAALYDGGPDEPMSAEPAVELPLP